jgi:hypothetical protein
VRAAAIEAVESNPRFFAQIFIGSPESKPRETAAVLAQELSNQSKLLSRPSPAFRAGVLIVMRYM